MSKAEKFIQESTRNCHNMIRCFSDLGDPTVIYHHWLLPKEAFEAVRIAREEVIIDTIEWIRINCTHYIMVDVDRYGESVKGTINVEQMVCDLKQAMEG